MRPDLYAIREAARRAIIQLREDGWWHRTGAGCWLQEGTCIGLALAQGVDDLCKSLAGGPFDEEYWRLRQALCVEVQLALAEVTGCPPPANTNWTWVYGWNDAPERTEAEVFDALDRMTNLDAA